MIQRVTAILLLWVASSAAQISPQFFAMHANTTQHWPNTVGVQFSSWRSLSAPLNWADINTAAGVYNWSQLDGWFATVGQNGQSILFTVYYTPSWASTCPKCDCLSGSRKHDGGCYPPNDLNPDGSGTDRHLKDFITALMQHVGPGVIQYLEIWNEPNITLEYTGTVQQLTRMAQDVRAIAKYYDPNIQITSPPETGDGTGSAGMSYLASFFKAGGGAYVDIIGLHGYVQNPEDIMVRLDATTAVMAQYGQSNKPIFVTEGSWQNNGNNILPAEQQPGFSFRHYLSILSRPVQRFYLYAFNYPSEGNLWDSSQVELTPGGTAYGLYYSWLNGATMTQPCQMQPGSAVWACTFSRPGNYQASAVWDASLPWGQHTWVPVSGQYVQYRDLYGNIFPIKNNQVPVGYDPIWLENLSGTRIQEDPVF